MGWPTCYEMTPRSSIPWVTKVVPVRWLIDKITWAICFLKKKRSRIAPRKRPVKLNLGCGLAVGPGWIGIDASLNALFAKWPRVVHRVLYRLSGARRHYSLVEYCRILRDNVFAHHDLSFGIPFETCSADHIYTSHFLEHMFKDEARQLIQEAYRVLRPGGTIRVCVPDLARVISMYEAGAREEALSFCFPSARPNYLGRHNYAYDFEMLSTLLCSVGFERIVRCDFGKGATPDIELLDITPDTTLYVEAVKPVASTSLSPVGTVSARRGSRKIAVLLDCSQIRTGGAIQAALALLGHAATDDKRQWHVVLSSELAGEVPAEQRSYATCHVIPPAGNALVRWFLPGRHLPAVERAVKPDVVFTLFGPAWWKARAPHVVGFARGLMLCRRFLARHRASTITRLRLVIEDWLRKRDFRHADFLVAETEAVRVGASRVLAFSVERIVVVKNSYSPCFSGEHSRHPQHGRDGPSRIFVPSVYYGHKNLESIPRVAGELRKLLHGSFEFVFTLPAKSRGWRGIRSLARKAGVEENVRTVGTVRLEDMASFYVSMDAVFLPTLFESSTAVYPESFLMGVPLVTSNLPFATEQCGDGALYVDPLSPESAARALHKALTDASLRETLIRNGREALHANYTSPEDKWRSQTEMLASVVSNRSGGTGT